MSLYEQNRQERIKQNLERMQRLGLFKLSSNLNSPKPKQPKKIRTTQASPPLLLSAPVRRSSRLQNVTPVTYVEFVRSKKRDRTERLFSDKHVKLEVGSKPEVYTEEHEKLLGNTERSWTLFVDGCGKDGRRIYDSINGKTCHQCRQKTLGYRTHCIKCQMVQGQFCGDCLYMRYGEHVLEALENPEWICPVCRGICNCSLCRQAKGWAPTGPLYRKISSLGYKSVAHYLFQTQRAQSDVKEKCLTINQVSAKKSLPFSDTETPLKESPDFNNIPCPLSKLGCHEPISRTLQFSSAKSEPAKLNCKANDQCRISNCEFKGKEEKESNLVATPTSSKNVGFANVKHELNELQLPKHSFEDKAEKEERELYSANKGHGDHNIAFMSCPKNKEKCMSPPEPREDSIAARLLQRRRSINKHANVESTFAEEETVLPKLVLTNESCDEAAKNRKEMDIMHSDDGETSGSGLKSKEKADCSNDPDPDSIYDRLRQRRRMSK